MPGSTGESSHTMAGTGSGAHVTVGIMAVQGAFLEHQVALQRSAEVLPQRPSVSVREIRQASDVTSDLQGLIIPGGESTTMSLFLRRNNMEEPLRAWIGQKRHVTWGTCAGMILLSKHTEHQKIGGQSSLGVTDTVVSRNYFGRQVDSFEADLPITHPQLLYPSSSSASPQKDYFRGVFIRAPAVLEVTDPSVEVLASLRLSDKMAPVVVAFRQGRVLSTAFHPELTEDLRWHRYFLQMVLSENQG
ncbi:pyridoxal 5'-phosphate synthase subunit PdxT-like [Babylonia areolata]|uniref:pyridoxal 5'-phosphate synthase subunit PdxT-like n=1 Tax=Babylonia areolata TaxID=304850 RepID=UPI003FD384A0